MKTNQTIKLSEMSLDEKIGQLMFVKTQGLDKRYLEDLHVGGIFLNQFNSQENYSKAINFYQDNSKIKLFVATDMEGYWNPFNRFYKSKNFGEINSEQEAFDLGKEQGEILNKMGFNLDFSPVVEVRNNVWKGRNFNGTKKQINEKISGYINGLHNQSILSTAKHYPGGSMIKNPHLVKFKTEIFKEDLEYFDYAISRDVDFIMVGHPIVYGAIDSNGKQATISKEVIQPLREKFEGIIITDAVTMLGLRLSYFWNFKKVYPDLILAGNDIILDTHKSIQYKRLIRRRDELKKAVLQGKISQERIDESVKRILEMKGYKVVE
jgi:beta-N-acetylhexosaminidase